MENNFPKNSIQQVSLEYFQKMLEVEEELAKQFNDFVEKFEKSISNEEFTWKDKNGNNLLENKDDK